MIGPISSDCFMRSPKPGALMQSNVFPTSLRKPSLINFFGYLLRSDTVHATSVRWSDDNGQSWSPAAAWLPSQRLADPDCSTVRRHYRNIYVCPQTHRTVLFYNEARLPRDQVANWYTHGTLRYAVSEDGGRTFILDEAVVDSRPTCGPGHPIPDVWTGKNSLMLGDHSCEALALDDGSLLLAPSITPMGEDGAYLNPYKALGFFEVRILRGTWINHARIRWDSISGVKGDPGQTTRGLDEATLGKLADGRLLMVMRGSNDRGGKDTTRWDWPGYRWHTISSDQGKTWSKASPWRYDDGTCFFSPASCSQLIAHPSGRLFWIGNIVTQNPWGNLPRSPIQIAEVDRSSGLLIKSSVTIIDERRPGECEAMMLSNFYARVDRETGDIVLHLTRAFSNRLPGYRFSPYDWGTLDYTSDAYQYRIHL